MALEKLLDLSVVTPSGSAAQVRCDSVTLPAADGKDGKGGGSLGIRPGHIQALIALAPGRVVAKHGGKVLLSLTVGSGYAAVTGDRVTVVTDSAESE